MGELIPSSEDIALRRLRHHMIHSKLLPHDSCILAVSREPINIMIILNGKVVVWLGFSVAESG